MLCFQSIDIDFLIIPILDIDIKRFKRQSIFEKVRKDTREYSSIMDCFKALVTLAGLSISGLCRLFTYQWCNEILRSCKVKLLRWRDNPHASKIMPSRSFREATDDLILDY